MSYQSGSLAFAGAFDRAHDDSSVPARLPMTQGADGAWENAPRSPEATRRASGVAATFDGRLDNREDLLLQAGVPPSDASTDRDVALTMFELCGVDGFRRLVGEWSVAIWDARHETLHLARDYMGARPLYYYTNDRWAEWSSDLAILVRRCGRGDALSAEFAARFLTLQPSPDVTPHEGIRAVPPGTCISITRTGRVSRQRFWEPSPGEIRYADARCYAEQLRTLWRDAVGRRLCARTPVWAELSGGLDSSSIACMAHRLISEGSVPASSLRLVSHATLRSPEGDERRFIAEVERQIGIATEVVGVEDHQDDVDEDQGWVTPYAAQGVGLETARRVGAAGGRIILSGRLGDAVMGCQPDNSAAVADDFARGAALKGLRQLRLWSRSTRKPLVELLITLLAGDARSERCAGAHLAGAELRALTAAIARPALPRDVPRSKRALVRMLV